MQKQIRGYVKFSVKGKRLYDFINALHKSHIYCFNQYCKNDFFYGEVYASNLKIVKFLANKYSVSLEYFEYETLIKKIVRYKKRLGLAIGVILIFAISTYFSNTVMMIEINGCSEVKKSVILSVLDDLGVHEGAFIGDIDLISCERQLRLKIDKISWAGMRRTGNRIVVDITEIVDTPDMLYERTPCNIVADKSAQITETKVYNGQLMRIVGDYVRQGDIIVSGIVKSNRGNLTKHHALAEIKGIYDETIYFTQPYYNLVQTPTGNTKSEKYLNLFSLDIPLFIGKNKFEYCSVEKSEAQLNIFGKKIPISITKKLLTENSYIEKLYNREEADALITEKIFLYEKNFLEDVKILDRKIEVSENEDELKYAVTYSVEGKIGINHDIYIK